MATQMASHPSPVPQDGLLLWLQRRDAVAAGFTWRGVDDVNNFAPSAAGADAAWQRLLSSMGADHLVQGEQVHGAQVAVLTSGPLRRRLIVPQTDGLITTVPGVVVAVRTADCVPVLLWAPGQAVAAVHAGWRGLVSGVLASAIREFARLNIPPTRLRAAIGPAIGPCCYEIGAEVAERLRALPGGEDAVTERGDRLFADLPALALASLASLGVPADVVQTIGLCTHCRGDLLFSYRREGEKAGRQVGAIVLTASLHN